MSAKKKHKSADDSSLTVFWTLWKVPITEPSSFRLTDSHKLLATSEATF